MVIRREPRMSIKRILLCLALGAATYGVIIALNLLPPSRRVIAVQGVLLSPGALAFSVFWPQGAHSDGGIYWVVLSVVGDVIFYAACWGVVIFLMKSLISRRAVSH